jgi:hypothetical protein
MKYNVCVTVRPAISTVLEVEADDSVEAEELAAEIILNDPKYSIADFNGQACEVLGDDITFDEVEAMGCDHEPDPASVRAADGEGRNRGTDWIGDVTCKKCGMSGSFRIDLDTIEFE